jgi:GTP diphosphokinase / guanosine-3',5'-bis(diphosphate) 3'-diphosphatase
MWEKFSTQLSHYAPADQKLIEKACGIAKAGHKNQKRETGDPYITHPIAVAEELMRLKLDAATVAAGILHDVLEDCDITRDELEREMGGEVTSLVDGITKLDTVRYQGFERKVESTRKMFLAVAEDIRVVLIKLADRLHNMRTIYGVRPEKRKRIAQETLEIYAPLAYRLGMGEWKGELEDLAFPHVYPEEYEWLVKELRAYLPKRKNYLETVVPIVAGELKAAGVTPLAIDFRTKRLYSLWRKLLRNDLDLARITDLMAIRVIVHTIEECYQTLGVIHALWKPLPGRIKDYIAMPKSNGYQSLHTTVFCISNITTEFQIRTQSMHEEAELGIAAHWAYEEAGKPKKGTVAPSEKTAWIKKLHDWQREFAEGSGEEFMEALKIDFFKDRIFALTPKGEVIDLPENATPVDFAYHIHSEIGDHMAGAKVNGKMVPFSHKLSSGDSVEIITQKNQKPNADWLGMAHSSLARGHIRSALRRYGIELRTPTKEKARDRLAVLRITRANRIGLLKDVTTLLAREHINIIKTEADAENVEKPFVTLQFRIPKKYELDKLIMRLRRIRGISQIELEEAP